MPPAVFHLPNTEHDDIYYLAGGQKHWWEKLWESLKHKNTSNLFFLSETFPQILSHSKTLYLLLFSLDERSDLRSAALQPPSRTCKRPCRRNSEGLPRLHCRLDLTASAVPAALAPDTLCVCVCVYACVLPPHSSSRSDTLGLHASVLVWRKNRRCTLGMGGKRGQRRWMKNEGERGKPEGQRGKQRGCGERVW